MRAGCRPGRRGIGTFVDDQGGYTSVAAAVAMLVSVSLVFAVASVEWTMSRAADVQPVADACAMAGQNTVAAYYTTAQVFDGCVLSMGLAGMAVLGAGLVMATIPGAQAASSAAIDAGSDILEARRTFARNVASGLQRLEGALPFAIVANSVSCVQANSAGGAQFTGAAIPFPLESQSDFSALDTLVNADEVSQSAEQLQDATRRMEEAKARADEARERAWRADCVDDPSCLRSRASSLAGLWDAENPFAPTPESWSFGMPIERSRTYYSSRLAQEAPQASDIESITDSLARAAFYEYALGEVNGAWYYEDADGHVSMSLPHLARNSDEMRGTWLYWDARWPCTEEEEEGRTLHSTWECPGATGSDAGYDSVAAVDSGAVRLCDACGMSVGDLGRVASISTSATNGYEHYWQIIVEAAQDYAQARNEQADAEAQMRGVAEQGKDAFQRAIDQLAVPRPRICPPGAWGCVSVVGRQAGTTVPSELTEAFLSGADLPAGVAVSAAALAPDDATNGNDVLSHFFDGIGGNAQGTSAFGDVCGLWGRLLVAYGNGYQGTADAVGGFFGRMDGLFGGTVGSWLKEKVAAIMGALGLQPADMRMRKPALVSSAKVLQQAGVDQASKVRSLVQALPSSGSATDIAHALGCWVWDQREAHGFTIAQIPLPGTQTTVPITIDLTGL